MSMNTRNCPFYNNTGYGDVPQCMHPENCKAIAEKKLSTNVPTMREEEYKYYQELLKCANGLRERAMQILATKIAVK